MKRTPLNRYTPTRAKTELKRGKGPKKSAKRLKRNPARLEKRFRREFHSQAFVDWIQALPCVACGEVPSQCAHVRSRGAGGRWTDIVPLCHSCHHEQHQAGILTFQERWGLDLEAEAELIQQRWPDHDPAPSTCECGHPFQLADESDTHRIYVCSGPGLHEWQVPREAE